ncbi:MAG: dGTPase [Solirubrobacteraceae bacterium]|nr:dGTPase [Solirubrobacteraceae bacterium]
MRPEWGKTITLTGRRQEVAEGFAQRTRELEDQLLSPLAARSYPARRELFEQDCTLRTPFQRERDRVVHSKAFRRLTHKTQVFVAPQGDHYRTRLTHTLEVTTISRTVARALRLNEDLVEAVGLGHDLGHPPFGHIGEEVLDACLKERFGLDFRHYEHSLRVVDSLERDGAGLNLTEQVRDGIARHSSRAEQPRTLEGQIVRTIDRVAYINHDIDDAVRAGLLRESDLPAEPIAVLGRTGSARIDALVHDMVEQSARAGGIVQGAHAGSAMAALREFMFERVYLGPAVRAEHVRIAGVVRRLFDHYVENPQELPDRREERGASDKAGATSGEAGVKRRIEGEGDEQSALAQRVTDFIAGMTDRYCIARFTELEVPQAFAR